MQDLYGDEPVARVEAFLDGAVEPFQTIVPPNTLHLDTTHLDDGEHELRLLAYDTAGNVGRRTIPFVVQNGPGITVTGLRANERVGGRLDVAVNAFGGNEPFDPIRAESSGPIPVWTWVMAAIIGGWAVWYGLAEIATPASYAATPTYESNPVAMAQVPMSQNKAPAYSGKGVASGFDYAKTGEQLYGANCAGCHGAAGAGVPGTFPALAGDPVVTAKSPHDHIAIVLNGLAGKAIAGKSFASQMPSFKQLSDDDVAAIIDHERTSWGNNAPIINPDDVKRAR